MGDGVGHPGRLGCVIVRESPIMNSPATPFAEGGSRSTSWLSDVMAPLPGSPRAPTAGDQRRCGR
jgi:hypothetical protein